MRDPYNYGTGRIDSDYDEHDERGGDFRWKNSNRDRQRSNIRHSGKRTNQETRKRPRVESRDGTFRCRNCKTMVGVPISGGKHRNHCPLCLFSRHVDYRRPGDRLSDCLSMMKAVGLYARPSGEQVLVHECLGCGRVRHNRVAADDNVVEVMRLPVVSEDQADLPFEEPERSA